MTLAEQGELKLVSRKKKEKRLQQKAKVIWITGLSGSGKTTLAKLLDNRLFKDGYFTQVLDKDMVRSGLNKKLGYTPEDRKENVRRVAEIAKMYIESGIICICAFTSPQEKLRKKVRKIIGKKDFIEIYLNTPLEVCEGRNINELYTLAKEGKIKNFAGVSLQFEPSLKARLTLDTSALGVEECVHKIIEAIKADIEFVPKEK